MVTRRVLQFVGAFLPALLLAGHFSGALTARAAQSGVAIQNFAFNPTPLTVTVGDTVTWTNMDTAPHNATAENGGFKTPDLQQGQSASITVNTPGEYTYICTIHPFMKATLNVQAAPTTAAPGSAPATTTVAPRPTVTTAAPGSAPATTTVAPRPTATTAAPVPAGTTMPRGMPSTGGGGMAPRASILPVSGLFVVGLSLVGTVGALIRRRAVR